MPHLTEYPYSVFIPLPTDGQLGPDMTKYLKEKAANWKDGRMMLGAGPAGRAMIELARSVFRIEGVNEKYRQFINLRICKLVGGVNPWDPNIKMLENLKASKQEIDGVQADGPVTGLDEDAALIMRACEELTSMGAIQDPSLAKMKERFGDTLTLRYILVMCWYNMFNRFLVSTRVPKETAEEVAQKVGDKTLPA